MSDHPELVRSIGRWSLAALVLNGIIGTGVFILPGVVADRLAWIGLLAWGLAALLTAVMVLCFAEVASRFSLAGGSYLFTRAAFGRFAGIQMGWMTYFVKAISAAVQANLFTTYLAEFWPWAGTRPGGVVLTTLFLGLLAGVNVQSVVSGARLSNWLTVLKTAPLLGFGAVGLVWIAAGQTVAAPNPSDPSAAGWLQVMLLLMFAFGGFESALIPLAEAKDPRRDAPFGLVVGLALVALVYLAAQLTVLATLDQPGAIARPLAASARVMLGGVGAAGITLAALLSVSGWVATNMLAIPRLTMAMADRGELPAWIGGLHPRFRTPWISILLFGGVAWVLANQAGLLQNISLSAVSRLFVYGLGCAALPVLRRKESVQASGVGPALFRAPAGSLMAAIGLTVSLVLATRMTRREGAILLALVALATMHWLSVRRRSRP
jgi:amino acid transporter